MNLYFKVNTADDDEPKGAQFTPDGGYIPRILFMDLDGNVMRDEINVGGNDKYKVCDLREKVI